MLPAWSTWKCPSTTYLMSDGLDVDLGELGVDGDVGRAARIERLDERSPIIRVGNDLVVVAAVEQHVALGMTDQVEADRDL